MKMKPEHFNYMKQAIDKTLAIRNGDGELVKLYEAGDFPRSEKVKDLQKRFCFDVYFCAGLTKWVCDTLYSYLNDDHIYTALKAICPKVVKRY